MNLDQLPALLRRLEQVDALLKRLEDHEARYSAIETGMMEQSASIAESVEIQTKQLVLLQEMAAAMKTDRTERADLGPLVDAIRGIKLTSPPAAAQPQDWSRLNVSIPQGEGRPARTMTITKGK